MTLRPLAIALLSLATVPAAFAAEKAASLTEPQVRELLTKQGQSKLVEQCSYPLTGLRCVSRVYTDLAVFDLGADGARVVEMADGLTIDDLSQLTGLPLARADQAQTI